jgi:hypothetical protein
VNDTSLVTTARAARALVAALAAALAIGSTAIAQSTTGAPAPTAPTKTQEQLKALQEAHRGDFDYLLGDWEYTAVRKMPDGPQTADRSADAGKTWLEGFMQIEARRIGPPRSLPALAPARNKK